MATKKKTLASLIGKRVLLNDRYKQGDTGPFEVLGVDTDCGFLCLKIDNKPFWWSLSTIEGIKEETETNE